MNEQWQMDLVDMQKRKYLLTVIDVFRKRAWAEPSKNKSGPEMVKALDCLKKQLAPHRPLRVQTDDGKEFFNRLVEAWFKKEGWHHFSTKGDTKAAVVERWHQTLKDHMYRAFTAQNTLKYLDMLPHPLHTYNQSYHRSVGMAPVDMTHRNEWEVWNCLYGKRLEQPSKKRLLKVGDRVRLNKKTPSV